MKSVVNRDTNIIAIFNLVRLESSSNVYLYKYKAIDERYFNHLSDAFFTYISSQYSFVVIETLYSQRQKELTRLADEYISGFNENIAMILGLDIKYGVESKKVSLFIRRPRFMSDPEKEGDVLLKTFSVREADIITSLLAYY